MISLQNRDLFLCIFTNHISLFLNFSHSGTSDIQSFSNWGVMQKWLMGREGGQEGFVDLFASVKTILAKLWDLTF